MVKKLLAFLLPLLCLCSCKSQNDLVLFSRNTEIQDLSTAVNVEPLKIEPNDELLINVSSEIPEAALPYNLLITNPAVSSSLSSANPNYRMPSYIVDANGDINFPVLGKIHVAGMTTLELADYLTKRISQDVENPIVRVQFENFKIRVLGQVQQPGTKKFTTEKVSILDAIAEAGDFSIFGRRDNVLLMREENGVITYHRLDFNDSELIKSPYFYVKQNDVIFVEPTEAVKGQAEYNVNNTYKISVISTIVSACSVIASLVIALLVK